jgi:hypothetical protein
MYVGMRIIAMLVVLVAGACDRSASVESSAPGGSVATSPNPSPAVESLRLESLYLNTSVRLIEDAPPARTVSLTLSRLSQVEMMGTLALDPNTCSLNAFGDREACTRIAVRGIDVELQRVRVVDPARAGRRLFEVTGEGVPKGLALIVGGDLREGELERCYLKLGSELVPLYLDDGV